HAGHVPDDARDDRLQQGTHRRHHRAVCDRRHSRRPVLRILFGPVRPATGDAHGDCLLARRRAVLDCRPQPVAHCRRRLSDAVLRAGRVGRDPGPHQRAVAEPSPRFLSRLRISARRDVRREHSLRRIGARRALHLYPGDGRAGVARVRDCVHRHVRRAGSERDFFPQGGRGQGLGLGLAALPKYSEPRAPSPESLPAMDLRQLEILQAIAETGSFTACGRKLNVSQSAISRQILLLEEELGEPLFLRVGRQVRMTPAAESLVQLGKRVFLDVRETVGAITDRTRELRGTLRLSGGMTVCMYVFPPLVKHLRRVHPNLDGRLTVATAGRSVQEIRGGRVDAGLLTLPVEDADMITVPVLREELLLVTTPTHPLARRRKVAPRDLARLPFILFEMGSATRKVIDNFFAGQNIEPTIVMDTENVEIIKGMVKAGLGAGIVPDQAVAREVKAGQLFCARLEGHELVRETGWVYAKVNRVPRMIGELLTAFDAVRNKLRLTPP